MTDQDADRLLRDRLERLAGAVPVALPATPGPERIVRGPVVWTQPVPGRLAIAAVLIATLGVAVWAGGIGWPTGPAASPTAIQPTGVAPTGEAPMDVANDGTFELVMSASRAAYPAFEPIDISTSLEYLGPASSIIATGSGSGLVGFGVQQIDGVHATGTGGTADCRDYGFTRGERTAVPFGKSGGYSEDDPDAAFLKDYFADPQLRLPPGSWRVYAIAQFTLGGCGGELHELRAEITIVVGELEVPASPTGELTEPAALQYPEGCATVDLVPDRCARIASWAVDQSGTRPDLLRRIELFGEPGTPCADTTACSPRADDGFVVRVRIVTTDGNWTDESLYCPGSDPGRLGSPLGSPINILCSTMSWVDDQGVEHPVLFPPVSTPTSGGYMDVPCNPGPAPAGCATPLPSLEPSAVDAARALTRDALDIPVDHVGTYSVRLGTARLANGILDMAAMTVASSPLDPLIASEGYRLEVTSLEGGPPFDNHYLRGWHPGTEEVEVTLTFTVNWYEPGAIVRVEDVVVR
jgi:hypothetical protein